MDLLEDKKANDVRMEASWKELLKDEFSKDYFLRLRDFVASEKKHATVYPPGNRIFAAFDHTPVSNVKVVIIGQDPYHGKGQANGLSFSVSDGIAKPPSLVNIFKELQTDLGIPTPSSGNLEKWADQGVLLLNATLTVRANEAASHQNKGWEIFTDAVIRSISDNLNGVIFLLWGRYAQAKETLIDATRHHILQAPHPSPLARGGFFGCRHFSKANAILTSAGIQPVDWRIE